MGHAALVGLAIGLLVACGHSSEPTGPDVVPTDDRATILQQMKDRLTPPSHAKRIAEQLPQLVRLTVLEDTGHMAPLERPDQVSEALLELAGKLGRALAGSAKV